MELMIGDTKAVVVALPLKECIKITGIKDGNIFRKNVRQSLGSGNKVNKGIAGGVLVHNACADADAGGSRKNTGEGGKSNDGLTVVARPGSETGGATLEIRISRNKVIKIRY